MTPQITTIDDIKVIGKHIRMSLTGNKTAQLWKGFIPRLSSITGRINNDLISMSIYDAHYFSPFTPRNEFDKWAAVAVADHQNVPYDMESFTLQGGLYAVFMYKGPASDTAIFQYIYTTWLPHSAYQLDTRPHFEILGEKYSNTDPGSEEEIWIPIKPQSPPAI